MTLSLGWEWEGGGGGFGHDFTVVMNWEVGSFSSLSLCKRKVFRFIYGLLVLFSSGKLVSAIKIHFHKVFRELSV